MLLKSKWKVLITKLSIQIIFIHKGFGRAKLLETKMFIFNFSVNKCLFIFTTDTHQWWVTIAVIFNIKSKNSRNKKVRILESSRKNKLTLASSCARPAIKDEIISGRINILSMRIKMSPGNEMSITESLLKFAYRIVPPATIPTITPRMVNISSILTQNHRHTWIKACKNCQY